jgi:hypothetical protein
MFDFDDDVTRNYWMSHGHKIGVPDLARTAKVAEEQKNWSFAIKQWDACLKAFPRRALRWRQASTYWTRTLPIAVR